MPGQGFEGLKPWYFFKETFFKVIMTFLTKNGIQIDLGTTPTKWRRKEQSMIYKYSWISQLSVSYFFLMKIRKKMGKMFFLSFSIF